MTAELSQALSVVLVVTISCIILSPVLWWILPDRTHSVGTH